MSLDFYLEEMAPTEVYWRNITHNLGKMAAEAGIYDVLWRPGEAGIMCAGDMVGPLSRGLALLMGQPDRFRALNPPNGWGDYEGFVDFVSDVLNACKENPLASVWVSR